MFGFDVASLALRPQGLARAITCKKRLMLNILYAVTIFRFLFLSSRTTMT